MDEKTQSPQFISLHLHWEQIEVFKYLPQLLNQQRIYFNKTKINLEDTVVLSSKDTVLFCWIIGWLSLLTHPSQQHTLTLSWQ